MNDGSKQRIVGAFVLLALGLIFFPLLFDLSSERQVDQTSIIPPQPDIKPAIIPQPTRQKDIEPAKKDDEIFHLKEEDFAQGNVGEKVGGNVKEKDLHSEDPALDEQGIPVAWVIQIASFREEGKASELVKKLQQDKYKSYLQKAKTSSGVTYRVLVGPKILKQAAIEEKQQIDRTYGSDAIIVRFKP